MASRVTLLRPSEAWRESTAPKVRKAAKRVPLQERAEAGGNYFASPKKNLRFIPSGCTTLDLALGGGWCEDRVSNVIGDKSTGKTLACIEAAANFIQLYPKSKVRYREAEEAFDNDYAEALGMPIKSVDFGGTKSIDTVEDFFDDLMLVCEKAKQPELYILDSLDALTDETERDRDIGQASYGGEKAKKMSQLFRRAIRPLADAHVTLMVVSQVRAKVGQTFGAGRTTMRTGGKALDFYASQVLYLTQLQRLTREVQGVKRVEGVTVQGKLDKNKVALPFRQADFPIMFGYGINDVHAMLWFLDDCNSLKEVGVGKKEIKKVAREQMNDPDMDFVATLREVTTRRWYEIETGFLPKRRKYQ